MLKSKILRKKIFGVSMLSMLLVGATTQVFATPRTYSDYILPVKQGNNYTGVHMCGGDAISNKVTGLSGTDQVTMWVANVNHVQTSNDYYFKKGSQQEMWGYLSGDEACVGMENSHYYNYTNGWVSGSADWK
ncbi:hypothetical protein ACJDU8_00550 [Clostridium sp. WILCCON 0269]|uniref:Lactococcin 972 family bacteriocin n=1 Tax=Candidatus Clostridium eludens TaxID=3381663 RepID=A0ABW8SGT6_9CLOT